MPYIYDVGLATKVHTELVGLETSVHPEVTDEEIVAWVIAINNPMGVPSEKLRTEDSVGFDTLVHVILEVPARHC
jgi:hypothetical protein